MAFLRGISDDEDALRRAELVLGELLANTVGHAPGLVDIEIDWTGEQPLVVVVDSGPGVTPRRPSLPDDELAESGRGLFLIHTFADELRMSPAPGGGTEIWVKLALRRTP